MTPEPIRRMLKIEEGEVLKLGPPMAGELVIKVHPQPTGAGFAVAVQTLLPHSHLPLHRYLQQDVVLFIHKGQGRAIVDGRSVTVVPGTTVHVPKQSWYGLRNTGTGMLQVVWTLVPDGAEQFFRALAGAGTPVDYGALQALALQHGIEIRSEHEGTEPSAASAHQGHHRRRHRGRRGHRSPAAPVAAPPVTSAPNVQPTITPHAPLPVAAAPAAAVTPAALPAAEKRRPWRPRSGRSHTARSGSSATPSPTQGRPPATPPTAAPRRTGDHRHHGRIKEVYMNGRWVRVAGDGPVIAPGKS